MDSAALWSRYHGLVRKLHGIDVLRIGLTGGIASGKSTVADMFSKLGVEIVDTDAIAHDLTAADGAAIDALVQIFGSECLTADGALDRPRMRRRVFANPDERKRLEAILHPLIRAEALARADASKAAYVIFVVPLLFETGFDRLVDRTVVVDCPKKLQIERLVARDGVDETAARSVIDAQMDRAERVARADDNIDSSQNLDVTQAQVAELHQRYSALAQNCSDASGRAE